MSLIKVGFFNNVPVILNSGKTQTVSSTIIGEGASEIEALLSLKKNLCKEIILRVNNAKKASAKKGTGRMQRDTFTRLSKSMDFLNEAIERVESGGSIVKAPEFDSYYESMQVNAKIFFPKN